jgi:hypothetical protein
MNRRGLSAFAETRYLHSFAPDCLGGSSAPFGPGITFDEGTNGREEIQAY